MIYWTDPTSGESQYDLESVNKYRIEQIEKAEIDKKRVTELGVRTYPKK